jgi:lysophospholipase L1-like esterase
MRRILRRGVLATFVVGAAVAAIVALHLPGRDGIRSVYRILVGIETVDGTYDIAVLGDSNARRGGWHLLFPNLRMGNFGVGGETVSEIARRVDQIVASKARKVFVLAGVNDLIGGRDAGEAAKDLVRIVDPLQAHGLIVYVNSLVCGIAEKAHAASMPFVDCARIRAFNLAAREVSMDRGANFIDLTDGLMSGDELRTEFTVDGLHLNEAGYRMVGKIWASRLERVNQGK